MLTALIGFAVLLLISFAGVPLGFATLIVGFGGFAMLRGLGPSASMAGNEIIETITNYNLSVLPLFLLMGVFIYRSNIANDLFDAAYSLVGRLKGGLAMATVLACAGFSAVCGSSLATAATMTKVAMPPMRRFNYADSLASGAVASGGTLGIMIPPSVPLVIYGIVADEDIAKLFIAGILPGILLVCLFMLAIAVSVYFFPETGPSGDSLPRERVRAARQAVWPVLALFILVLGGIYVGFFTPTEAAGIGAAGAALIAWWRGALPNLKAWISCLIEAGVTTATLFTVLFSALVFSQFINLSGLPYDIVNLVNGFGLSPLGIVLAISAICVVLGMVFEAIGILVLVVPVFIPTLIGNGVDLIWFGIVVVVLVELGLVTPPIGMNIFTVKAVLPDLNLRGIFVGVLPFIMADFIALTLLFIFPVIATFLVR